jgi:2-polyprenyl-6-methoxyphenol hydroxylase-like FAD-dependent oxidoreductase
MAIEDAVVLARRLSAAGDPAKRLAEYARERYRRTAAVTKRSWRIGRVGHWEGRVSSWFRDRLLGLLAPVVAASGYARYAAFDVGPLAPGAAAEELSGA